VAGQCFESVKKSSAFSYAPPAPPNGLQLTLTDASVNIGGNGENQTDALREHCSDTLVMQNLGYYQLQAQPGLYSLQLAEGRASELFTIDGATLSSDNGDNYEFSNTEKVSTSGAADGDNDESPIEDDNRGKVIAVKSFADVVHRITVTKRPGMEKVPLLEGGEDDDSRLAYRSGRRRTSAKKKKNKKKQDSSWSSGLSNLFGGGNNDAKGNGIVTETKKDDTIHVFSLATGHMYERLLRIMMLSVTKRTSAPVKFWLFENYLSPSFKAQAKAMAQEYNFEVAYVTYKWPEWLTQQTNKQRIIWGYKILFLDVLFPLNVDKVIYVDADQVLRADLKELWDLDLEGKPYAYTPFCDSRKETLGFQFWRQGYWNEHLRGRPYHISALYVVDLANFRRNAVGDQLRAVYDTLARDPNSLANLDQDLPNYAQHSVPIHSLPQEWLWCESWCSDESKAKAKTIDLCNNPLHKEPKLDMARRVVSGSLFNESWIELDDEIRRLQIREGFQLDS
jgi:UDP-glucose:glycoprotein glucosyltransferase